MQKNPIVVIQDLTKTFQMGQERFNALDGINLTINEGDFLGFIGPSGSGKTTLLNVIGTLDAPTQGDVIILEKSSAHLTAKQSAKLRRNNIGFIFQNYSLLPVYTVYENIEYALLLQNIAAKQRKQMVLEAIEWVGLSSKLKSKPGQLSGGECQRVAIARAMVKKPSIVLADEPSANLDSANSHNILKVMKKLNEEFKTTFVFSTHDEKVMSYLDRKVYLNDGKIIQKS